MKRIFLIIVLLLYIPIITFAFEEPDPQRWYWVASDDKKGYWIDRQTLKFSTRNMETISCYNHKFVTAWLMVYNAEEDKTALEQFIFDLDCKKSKLLYFTLYDEQGNLIDSFTPEYSKYEATIPGTYGEAVQEVLTVMWYAYSP